MKKAIRIRGRVERVFQVNLKESYGEVSNGLGVVFRSAALLALVGREVELTVRTVKRRERCPTT